MTSEDSTSSQEGKTVVETVRTRKKVKTKKKYNESGGMIKNIFWFVEKSFTTFCMVLVTLIVVDVRLNSERGRELGWKKKEIHKNPTTNIEDELGKESYKKWKL